MVKFDYLSDGRIVGVRDIFSAFNEPSIPIPLEVTALTNITDDMVAGHRIDEPFRAEIYLSEIEPRLQALTAFTRFSARA
jgi:DNA polymerase III epsilon subunit-like protein